MQLPDSARQQVDVIVVGSGASGGWAAKRLCEAGVKVALLDAGRAHGSGDYREHARPFDLRYRDSAPEIVRRTRPTQKDCYACTEYNADWFAHDLEEPYTTPVDSRSFGRADADRRRAYQLWGRRIIGSRAGF